MKCYKCKENEAKLRVRIRIIEPPYYAGVLWCLSCWKPEGNWGDGV